ncbi:MAG: hypothetical protein PHR30_16620 [Gallionellaceae bacterium]|nr:hypothetical protein [Gallionellaceae bacterium]
MSNEMSTNDECRICRGAGCVDSDYICHLCHPPGRSNSNDGGVCVHCGRTLLPTTPTDGQFTRDETVARVDLSEPGPLMLTIERASNGYIVRYDGDTHVIETEDDINLTDADGADARAFVDLCNLLAELVGVLGSRYDAQRAYCVTYPGDKHATFDTAECPVCRRGGADGRQDDLGAGRG